MRKLIPGLMTLFVVVAFATPVHAQVGFGRTAAVGDGEVFVGEPGNRVTSGIVYVYRPQSGTWVEARQIVASDASEGDGFGTAITVEGELMLISAVSSEHGVVYMFHRDGRNWVEAGTLTPDGVTPADRFGGAIHRDGTQLIVGATNTDDGWGAAYVFEMQDHQWVQVARLTGTRPEPEESMEDTEDSSEAAEGDDEEGEEESEPTPERFGSAVAIAGPYALVGAPGANQRSGLVYVFKQGDEGWDLLTTMDGGEDNDRFGSGLAIHDMELFVTAAGANENQGAVQIFRHDPETDSANQIATLRPFDGGRFAGFGSAVAFDGSDVLISAPRGDAFNGVIYRFSRDASGGFTGATKMGAAGGRTGFGGSIAIAGDTMVVGMTSVDRGAGAAAIMSRAHGGWDRTRVISEMKSLPALTGELIECANGKVDRFDCQGVDLLAFLPLPAIGGSRGSMINDIWGWTDPESGKDYAIAGLSHTASFVDVSDPYNPVFVGSLPMTDGANPSAWRDIKVYSDHAFIVSDAAGEHGMQVFDLTHLREYDGEPIVYTADVDYPDINSAHNIVINEDTAFAFIVGASGGGETCGGGLHMVNIEDPKQPVFAGCFQDTSTGRRGTGYSHDAQCITYQGPDERYSGREICFGSNETALSVADVTDKRNPKAIGMSSYPNVAYSHQGWVTDDHMYFYMNDEGDEASGLVEGTRTIIWDVQDLEDPIVISEYISDNPAIDHNLFVVGNVMYQSNYDSGLRIFDVSDPVNIKPIGYLDTVPFGQDGQGMGGSWGNYPYFKSGVVVVTSMGEGLFVAKLRDDARPADTSDGMDE